MTTPSWSFKRPYINNQLAVRGNTVTRRSFLFSISVRFPLPLGGGCAHGGLPTPSGGPPGCSRAWDLSANADSHSLFTIPYFCTPSMLMEEAKASASPQPSPQEKSKWCQTGLLGFRNKVFFQKSNNMLGW